MSEPGLSISESASLEHGYRRLLAWYPKWFRLQNTEEVLAVLMAAGTSPGLAHPEPEAGGVTARFCMRNTLSMTGGVTA